MPLLRLHENIGTIGDDILTGAHNSVTFGSHGNDSLTGGAQSEYDILVGGIGDDTYNLTLGASTTIYDRGSSQNDNLLLSGVNLVGDADSAPVYSYILDGRHLGLFEEVTQTQVIIINWLQPEDKIENIILEDTVLSADQLSVILPASEYFLGDFTWENSGVSDGFSTSDINEALSFYALRNAAIEALPAPQFSHIPTHAGTDDSDIIVGDTGDNIIDGNGGNDSINAGDGVDEVRGGTGSDWIHLGGGDDIFANGNTGNDTLYGGAGNDARVVGGKDQDSIYGEAGSDFLNGNMGFDTLYGGTGNDTIHGGRHEDALYGGSGDDLLYGDLGNDTLTGGEGADIFIFNVNNSGMDVITDFVSGLDILELHNTSFASASEAANAFSAGVLDFNNNTITLTGIMSLTEGDITIL